MDTDVDPPTKKILCICPKCRKQFKKLVFWIGNTKIPKFFCDICKKESRKVNNTRIQCSHNIEKMIKNGCISLKYFRNNNNS